MNKRSTILDIQNPPHPHPQAPTLRKHLLASQVPLTTDQPQNAALDFRVPVVTPSKADSSRNHLQSSQRGDPEALDLCRYPPLLISRGNRASLGFLSSARPHPGPQGTPAQKLSDLEAGDADRHSQAPGKCGGSSRASRANRTGGRLELLGGSAGGAGRGPLLPEVQNWRRRLAPAAAVIH